jgi:hypothetical protein
LTAESSGGPPFQLAEAADRFQVRVCAWRGSPKAFAVGMATVEPLGADWHFPRGMGCEMLAA